MIGHAIYSDPEGQQAYWINVFTSVLGIAATVLILDELNRKRLQDEYKRQLIDDAASTSNEIAKNAVHQIRRKQWLSGENGILKGKNFQFANLQHVDFQPANLQDTDLSYANLQSADFRRVNLKGATLVGAKLCDAFWGQADLRGANFTSANLKRTVKEFDDFLFTKFDEKTTLPDGSLWSRKTDLTRLTDPKHPDFWEAPVIE